MSASSIALLVVAVLLVPLAGLFAAMDAALQRVSKARVEELRREGTKRAGALEEVVEDRARHVALLLLLRILLEMVAAVLVTLFFFDLWGSTAKAVAAAAAVMTVVSYVLVGDIVDAYERWDASRTPARPATGPQGRTPRVRRQGS